MKVLAQALRWLLTGALFLLLFAFSLNNQAPVQVHFIFGYSHTVPLIIVVLAALGIGIVLGVVGMLPYWLSLRRKQLERTVPLQESNLVATTRAAAPVYRNASTGPITEYGP
jgi:putative membrane protein